MTPTILFSLLTCPLTSNQFQQLEVVKKRMLRSIVGWAPLVDNDWHEFRQKVNRKLENAQQIFNVTSWPFWLKACAPRLFSLPLWPFDGTCCLGLAGADS